MLKPAILFLLTTSALVAQQRVYDPNFHSWFSYSGEHQVSGKWGVHFDGQWRRSDGITEWQQWMARPAVNYSFNSKLMVSAGYAYAHSWPYGDFPGVSDFPEHRAYEQLIYNQTFSRRRLQHRARLEQRFVGSAGHGPRTWSYRNRFRYQAKAEIPFTASKSPEWYISAFDEIFIGIAPDYGARPFDQNRAFVGIGRSAGRMKVEAGYMNQFVGQRNGRIWEVNHTLFFTVISSRPLRRLFSAP